MIWDIETLKRMNEKSILSYAKDSQPRIDDAPAEEVLKQLRELAVYYDRLLDLCWDIYDSDTGDEVAAVSALKKYLMNFDMLEEDDLHE
jgi:copper homeostasis protein CutC